MVDENVERRMKCDEREAIESRSHGREVVASVIASYVSSLAHNLRFFLRSRRRGNVFATM